MASLAALAVTLLVLPAAHGRGQGDDGRGAVVLLQPGDASAGVRSCLTRVREELLAGGFDVRAGELQDGVDPLSIVEALAAASSPATVATIALVGDPERGPAELWMVDRIGPEPTVRRIVAPPDAARAPEVLAIRTLELLRASALALLVQSTRRTARPAAGEGIAGAGAPPSSGALTLESGAAVLQAVRGPGPALLPALAVRLRLGGGLHARLAAAGLGTRPQLSALLGSARVQQDLVLAQVAYLFRPARRVQPLLSVGGGVLHVAVEGEGHYPYEGRSGIRWVGVADGVAGVVLHGSSALALLAEAHVLFAPRRPVVRFSDVEAGVVGWPSLMATLALVVTP